MKYLLIVAMLAGTAWGGDQIFLPSKWTCADHIRNVKAMGCEMRDTELIEAAKGVLPYLEMENEPSPSISFVHPIGRMPTTPAQDLRRRADELEKRDAAIKRFREALEPVK